MPGGTLEMEESSRLLKASREVRILNAGIYLGQTMEPLPLCLILFFSDKRLEHFLRGRSTDPEASGVENINKSIKTLKLLF